VTDTTYEAIACPEWFQAWTADYCVSFGLGADFADVMLRRWWPAFQAAKYQQHELSAALQRVAAGANPPRWPADHLPAVNSAIRDLRVNAACDSVRETKAEGQPCYVCNWSGLVMVPHPACVKDGDWVPPHYTATVYCTRCGPGNRSYERACELAREKKISAGEPMTFDRYQHHIVPNWRELLLAKDERDRLMRRAVDATEGVSSTEAAIDAALTSMKGKVS
jgi:hypothetical protein